MGSHPTKEDHTQSRAGCQRKEAGRLADLVTADRNRKPEQQSIKCEGGDSEENQCCNKAGKSLAGHWLILY
jgi:hypothetical protein